MNIIIAFIIIIFSSLPFFFFKMVLYKEKKTIFVLVLFWTPVIQNGTNLRIILIT